MRTHILLALLTLVVSACASKEKINPESRAEREQQREEQFTRNEFEAQTRFR